MLMEVLIVLETIAFVFLALGLIPFKKKEGEDGNQGNLPLVNKVVFILVAAIIFFSLGITSNAYDYNYCYINKTIANYATNSTTSTATCAAYVIYNPEMAYLNMFFGLVSIVLLIIIVLIAIASRNDRKYIEN